MKMLNRLRAPKSARSKSAKFAGDISRYHCCIQKTASQWFAGLFEDAEFQELSGVTDVKRPGINFLRKDEQTRAKLSTLPMGKLLTPVYIEYPDFLQHVATGPWMAAAVVRDPRDIIVSGYFSILKSHDIHNEDMARRRKQYQELGQDKGISQQINDGVPYYEALRSWIPALTENKVSVFRFEDVFGENHVDVVEDFFRAIGIFLNRDDLQRLCDKHSFQSKTGRKGSSQALSKGDRWRLAELSIRRSTITHGRTVR